VDERRVRAAWRPGVAGDAASDAGEGAARRLPDLWGRAGGHGARKFHTITDQGREGLVPARVRLRVLKGKDGAQ